ncbi:hypothetical protein M422DRAFT_273634 [Sphaerobolus stellatus SS14]|uniref:Protein kinase domain-containing protein n=1 Tax=Sphaerobolus stellatus (strain SS14) TaxID=990650 RepID=A0A0C9TUD4_SPHS4|nr:hypothetical protein M422DRAFT_273634 [Sphaerobolus stellatus SS14]
MKLTRPLVVSLALLRTVASLPQNDSRNGTFSTPVGTTITSQVEVTSTPTPTQKSLEKRFVPFVLAPIAVGIGALLAGSALLVPKILKSGTGKRTPFPFPQKPQPKPQDPIPQKVTTTTTTTTTSSAAPSCTMCLACIDEKTRTIPPPEEGIGGEEIANPDDVDLASLEVLIQTLLEAGDLPVDEEPSDSLPEVPSTDVNNASLRKRGLVKDRTISFCGLKDFTLPAFYSYSPTTWARDCPNCRFYDYTMGRCPRYYEWGMHIRNAPPQGRKFAMEHVYEAQLVTIFLNWLSNQPEISMYIKALNKTPIPATRCKSFLIPLFWKRWTKTAVRNPDVNPVGQSVTNRLSSANRVGPNEWAYLQEDLNGMKALVMANANLNGDATSTIQEKLVRLARVALVLEYLQDSHIAGSYKTVSQRMYDYYKHLDEVLASDENHSLKKFKEALPGRFRLAQKYRQWEKQHLSAIRRSLRELRTSTLTAADRYIEMEINSGDGYQCTQVGQADGCSIFLEWIAALIRVAGHSLRSGGATALALAGVADIFHELKQGDINLQGEIERESSTLIRSPIPRVVPHPFKEYHASTSANGMSHRITVKVYKGEESKEFLKTELQIMARLRHPNFAQVMGFCRSQFFPSIYFMKVYSQPFDNETLFLSCEHPDLRPVRGLNRYGQLDFKTWTSVEDLITRYQMVGVSIDKP